MGATEKRLSNIMFSFIFMVRVRPLDCWADNVLSDRTNAFSLSFQLVEPILVSPFDSASAIPVRSGTAFAVLSEPLQYRIAAPTVGYALLRLRPLRSR
jgi:hypothetical protein